MDENKLKALFVELVKGLKTEADINQFSRMLTVETLFNAELTGHLGYKRNAPKNALIPVATRVYPPPTHNNCKSASSACRPFGA